VITVVLTAALLGMPAASDEKTTTTEPATEAPRSSFSRFSEGGLNDGNDADGKKAKTGDPKKKSTKTTTGETEGDAKGDAAANAKTETKAEQKKRNRQEMTTKKAVDHAREETAEMLEEVKGVISKMEKGQPVSPDVTVRPASRESKGPGCDLELPQVLAFELQRIRAVRDEAEMMLEMHEQNLKDIENKLAELEKVREQLDKSRAALEETLSRKSVVEDDKEKERRRLRLLMSSRAMKPKKIAALMDEISLDEARVLLEALDELTSKAVLEALSPERLARIVAEDKSSSKKTTEPTTTSAKPKETL
jgi:hypothetical protein